MSTQSKTQLHSSQQELDAHIITRRFRTGVRFLLAFALIATVICLFFFQEFAHLAAIPIPVLYVVLAFTNYLEIRARAANFHDSARRGISREELEIDIETVGIVTLLKVLGALAVGTFIVAASFFEWRLAGTAAAALFFLAILILSPYLPLFITEVERDELEKLRKE